MLRPGHSCAPVGRRTPTAPRSIRSTGGTPCSRRSHAAGGLDDVAAVSIAGQQHGMVVLDAEGRVIRPALLWNDTRSAQAARDLIDEVGAEAYAERTGVVPVASFTATKLRWLRDAEPANAERVAAVALPHDWLTWRLRGYGPIDATDAPRGPVIKQLVTDRSDASGTAYWGAGGYDRELLVTALGHHAILPRVLGPSDAAGSTPAGALVGSGAGDNAAAALGLDAAPGDVVVSIGTSGTVFAVTEAPVADASGTVAGFADATGNFLPLIATLNAARVLDATAGLLGVDHEQLGRLGARGGARVIRCRARAVLRGRTHAEPARRDRLVLGADAREHDAPVDRARRGRGPAVRARRRPRRRARPGRRRRAGAAHRRGRAEPGGACDRGAGVRRARRRARAGGVRRRRRRPPGGVGADGGAPDVAGGDRRGTGGRHAGGHPAAVRGGGGTSTR